MSILDLFDANNVLVKVNGYNLSGLELLSTVFGLWSYVEIIRRRARGLLLGICASILLSSLFYQLRLYSDMGLMAYYAAASLAALVFWRRSFKKQSNLEITRLSRRMRLVLLVVLPLSIGLIAYTSTHLQLWLPGLFPNLARFPLGDATTTVLGIAASILLIQRKTECMALWLIADGLATFI